MLLHLYNFCPKIWLDWSFVEFLRVCVLEVFFSNLVISFELCGVIVDKVSFYQYMPSSCIISYRGRAANNCSWQNNLWNVMVHIKLFEKLFGWIRNALKVKYKGILFYEILMDCVARKRMQKTTSNYLKWFPRYCDLNFYMLSH